MRFPDEIRPVEGVVDVLAHGFPGDGPPLLIELPHGATDEDDFFTLARRMRSELPDGLVEFFRVNTDFGTPEAAAALTRTLAASRPATPVLTLRCRLPRTFVDCNRRLDDAPVRLTPAIPPYVDRPDDREVLAGLHGRYGEVAEAAYRHLVGERGGLAIALHSFAPRSVGIERVDGGIVAALRDAYRPENVPRWPERPELELIGEDDAGRTLVSASWRDALFSACAEAGVALEENRTYRLHTGTLAHHHATRFPERVLCVELNRGRIARRWNALAASEVSAGKLRRYVAPLASATSAELDRVATILRGSSR